ncbi:4-alpha-glucanotransferase [Elusimicrobium posterum]|uniref:4-alpha-glucanotransferase n=1 Tax=Elusimicrobium posterum TaxID=3116653 RepID=UPI003C72C071
MKIVFNINYYTAPGEEVKALYSVNGKEQECSLTSKDGQNWVGEEEVKVKKGTALFYNYQVCSKEKNTRKEWSVIPRKILLDAAAASTFFLYDAWRDLPKYAHLYTSAAQTCLNPRKNKETKLKFYKQTLILRAMVPQVKDKQKVLLCTNQTSLDNWHPAKALKMTETSLNEWSMSLDVSKLRFPLEYKFVIYDEKTKSSIWHAGYNHIVENLKIKDNEIVSIDDIRPIFYTPNIKAAGVVLPVFSLRSESSFGVGDFGDIKKLADWAEKTDQKVVQILPINDTTITETWKDSYPYNSISIYAYHPMYIDLNQLPLTQTKKFKDEQKRLNALAEVDYEEVNKLKRAYIRKAFEKEAKTVFASADYKEFFKQNQSWLLPYAAFSYLRDTNGTPEFKKWTKYSTYKKAEIEKLCAPTSKDYEDISFYYYMQYKLHCQLLEAADYARSKGIILKGDIPIGICPESVEAWTEPYYFNMNAQAGAPPDDFSANGQNWGFPTYNWDVMAKDGYNWWVRRFAKMAEYFDAYRIDHVLGFFRIWEIPMHSVHGLLGQFSPAMPMSPAEIGNYGIHFREDFLKPYIADFMLDVKFGPQAEDIKKKYLKAKGNGLYEMLPEYNTQRKVEAVFKDKKDSENIALKEALYSLISNVLFVEDHKTKGVYHPRISAQNDFAFKALNSHEQYAFTNLYNHYFYERHNEFWYNEAMKKLPVLLQSTSMLVCAEDLGMIPASVSRVMDELQMLSLEIQRMPKDPAERFANINRYPYLSVCTISTHDMPTLRGWWEEDYNTASAFYHEVLHRGGAAPKSISGELCEQIVKNHLNSPSMLCVLSFQDWIAIDEKLRAKDPHAERINIPAIPRYYWRYRMHMTLEKLMKSASFNKKVRSMIESSGR